MPDMDLDILLKLQDRASRPLQKAVGKIDKQATKSTKNLANLGRALRSHWLAVTGTLIAVGFIFNKIVGTAIKFEDAFAGVRKTVDATEEEFAELAMGLRELSKEIPVAAIELAEIQEIAGQLGVRGVNNLKKFTEVVAKISVTTNLTREAAATNFARIANVMQEPLKNIDRMGAAIVDLGNNFATTEAEISTFASRIAGAGRVAGLTTSDIFAFGAAFSSVGVKAERGGTAVSKALIMMGTAVVEGGERLEDFANIAGLTSEEFIKAYEENASKAFALFIEGLGRSGLKGAAILKELQLGDQRLVQAFLSVGGASGILTRAIDMSNEAFEKNIALNEEAAKRFGTTASQIQLFKNHIDDLNISLGGAFLPTLQKILPELSEFIEKIGVLLNYGTQGLRFRVDIEIPDEEIAEGQRLFEEAAKEGKMIGSEFFAFQEYLLEEYGRTLDWTLERGVIAYEENKDRIVAVVETKAKETTKVEEKAQKKSIENTKKAEAERRKVITDAVMDNIQTAQFYYDFLSQTVLMAAQENKKFAVLAKAIRMGQAIINTATAVTRAYADFPFPASMAIAALMTSLGAAQVAMIAAQEFHKGGTVKAHAGLAIDEVPIIAQRGEGILRRSAMADIGGEGGLNRINQGEGIGGLSVNIENASFREDQDIEDVINQIAEGLEEQKRARI